MSLLIRSLNIDAVGWALARLACTVEAVVLNTGDLLLMNCRDPRGSIITNGYIVDEYHVGIIISLSDEAQRSIMSVGADRQRNGDLVPSGSVSFRYINRVANLLIFSVICILPYGE